MSQAIILELMRELGGRATSAEIAELAKKKYPNLSLHEYVGSRLTKMYAWGDIDFADEKVNGRKKRVWFVVEQGAQERPIKKPSTDIIYSCGECKRNFETEANLHRHQSQSH